MRQQTFDQVIGSGITTLMRAVLEEALKRNPKANVLVIEDVEELRSLEQQPAVRGLLLIKHTG